MIIKNNNKIHEIINSFKNKGNLYLVTDSFSIFAFHKLNNYFSEMKNIRILFNDEDIKIIDEKYDIELALKQRQIANDFLKYINENAYIRKTDQINGSLFISPDGVILNNSKFDLNGLGYINDGNIYINSLIEDDIAIKEYKEWFMKYWTNNRISKDFKNEFLEQVEKISSSYSPEYVYYYTLSQIFNDYSDELDSRKEKIGFYDTKIWNLLYKFQKDGVMSAINKIEEYNGCIIADSVGLGKTFEALAIIKFYELMNKKVLVLCPKKLRDNWTVYTYNSSLNVLASDRFNYDVLNHTDLSREGGYSGEINLSEINWGNYDLIVIDESHNFRNNNREDDRQTRYAKLMDDIIKSGIDSKVLMLSATPVNTSLYDLRNQIHLITEEDDHKYSSNMGIRNISYTIKTAQNIFEQWSNLEHKEQTTTNLINNLNNDFFKLLDQLTIARSRNHVTNYYNNDNISFSKRLKPISKFTEIDKKGDFISFSELNESFLSLDLSIYTPSKFIHQEFKNIYKEIYDTELNDVSFTQVEREYGLVHMMRINYLKRLESSIHSFRLSIERLLLRVEDMINNLINYDGSEVSFNIYDIKDIEDEEQLEDVIGKNVKIHLKHMDRDQWLNSLTQDYEVLKNIFTKCSEIKVDRDKKLQILKDTISKKVENPINDNNRKVLVFTTFSDTAEYIYQNISDWANKKYNLFSALVTGSGKNKTNFQPKGYGKNSNFNMILTNFSPKSKSRHNMSNMPNKGEIDLLIGTDCISEGQNLQDCDCLINFDIHWNPVRIVQRFGRIDRIGSQNEKIQLINFWPSKDLNEYINLKNRVESRMEISDISSTVGDNPLKYEQESNKDNYRNKQLLRMKDEILDLEDLDNQMSLTNFNFNDFRMEIKNILEKNQYSFQNTPEGIFSIVTQKNSEPGVIFCLKFIGDEEKLEKFNHLYPYYLVYINKKGEIKYNYYNSKKILVKYKKIASGKRKVDDNLFQIYDKYTDKNVADLMNYLNTISKDIFNKNEKESFKELRRNRRARIIKNINSDTGLNSFKIISYLLIE